MKIEKSTLLEELNSMTDAALVTVKSFKHLSLEELNFKNNQEEWSILECIEHLNLYGTFYLPEIEHRILNSNDYQEQGAYKSSFIGDFFVNSIKASNTKKVKAMKTMIPDQSNLSLITIDQFIKQLQKLKSLLQEAEKMNLMKIKTAISLTKFIKLRLGDTLRFLIHHNERHILQAGRLVPIK